MNEKITSLFLSCFLLFTPVLSGCKTTKLQPDNTAITETTEFVCGELSAIISEIDDTTSSARDNLTATIETAGEAERGLYEFIEYLGLYEAEVSRLLDSFDRTRERIDFLEKTLKDFNNSSINDDNHFYTFEDRHYLSED